MAIDEAAARLATASQNNAQRQTASRLTEHPPAMDLNDVDHIEEENVGARREEEG
ncbi:hypothetical protein F444_13626 [Phytophthora nicotianae P1976]|uniref:Uncharacterized protein n=1 Tax=Phytophthora nicotianae P1976 TaxID=1317066 RepID=A0A080ZT92_PHYNI|nr:hypothetical protein F444_13626 [Phytophthora nicotianae P1976]